MAVYGVSKMKHLHRTMDKILSSKQASSQISSRAAMHYTSRNNMITSQDSATKIHERASLHLAPRFNSSLGLPQALTASIGHPPVRRLSCSPPDLGHDLSWDSQRPPRLQLGHRSMQVNVKGTQKTLNYMWLRENCRCGECYNPDTYQRIILSHHIPEDIKPKQVEMKDGRLDITWPDGHQSSYSSDWLMDNTFPMRKEKVKKFLWDSESLKLEDVPRVKFGDFMASESSLRDMLHTLLVYGFALVDEVPASVEGTREACERICVMQNTFYGEMYDFTADLAFSDTAYTNIQLGAHTDTTYFSQPCGIQVLHCLHHHGSGGLSLVLDGFDAARKFKEHFPQSYELLATVPIPHEYKETGKRANHHYSVDTILKVNRVTDELEWIRYNPYDRAPLNTVPPHFLPQVYRALSQLSAIVEQPRQELWFKLQPGTVLFVDNYRAMHGRSAFDGSRRICGCYLPRDEWRNTARTLGLLWD